MKSESVTIINQIAQEQAIDKLHVQQNIATIADELAKHGITSVEIGYDGQGDSGEINDITFLRKSDLISIEEEGVLFKTANPIVFVELSRLLDNPIPDIRKLNLREAIDEVGYQALESIAPGWEIDDGSFGIMTLDVADRSLSIKNSTRFTEVDTETHLFKATTLKPNPTPEKE